MRLSTFISRPWHCQNVFIQRLATTRCSPLPNRPKRTPLPALSRYRKTTINKSPVNVTPKTFERSEKARPSVRPSSESCAAKTPTSSPRDPLGDDGKNRAPKEGTLAADELKERLAMIAAQTERSPEQSTHQQSFTRAPRNLRPDDNSDTRERSLEDPTSPRVARATPLVCDLPCRPCLDGNSDAQDDSVEALSFPLAKCLGTLGVDISPRVIELNPVEATKILLEKIDERRRSSVGNPLTNYYNVPSGRQHDLDIDDETSTGTNTTAGTDTDTDITTDSGISMEDDIHTSSYINDDIDADEINTDDDPGDGVNDDERYMLLKLFGIRVRQPDSVIKEGKIRRCDVCVTCEWNQLFTTAHCCGLVEAVATIESQVLPLEGPLVERVRRCESILGLKDFSLLHSTISPNEWVGSVEGVIERLQESTLRLESHELVNLAGNPEVEAWYATIYLVKLGFRPPEGLLSRLLEVFNKTLWEADRQDCYERRQVTDLPSMG
ncbi:hypothetical protein CEP54_015102 [Fusarium duplospermum]|uniref:Uncharacterized protein n=1 Tax=Fusarium duplospermum TaxID=1325734 RepID=A0A428NRF8_9HYPO|nr:hypothetical protein CEP54_015102 [Fusarium duplospermum]